MGSRVVQVTGTGVSAGNQKGVTVAEIVGDTVVVADGVGQTL